MSHPSSSLSVYDNKELFGQFLLEPFQWAERSFQRIGSPIDAEGCGDTTIEVLARAALCVVAPIVAIIGLLLMPFALAIKWFSLQCCAPEIDEPRHPPHHVVHRERLIARKDTSSDSDSSSSSEKGFIRHSQSTTSYLTNNNKSQERQTYSSDHDSDHSSSSEEEESQAYAPAPQKQPPYHPPTLNRAPAPSRTTTHQAPAPVQRQTPSHSSTQYGSPHTTMHQKPAPVQRSYYPPQNGSTSSSQPALNPRSIEAKVEREFGATHLDGYLRKIYGEKEGFPWVSPDESKLATYEFRLRLLYMPHQQVLNLSVAQLKKYAELEPELLYRRLLLINEMNDFDNSTSNKKITDYTTLRKLLRINGCFLSKQLQSFFPAYFGMLSRDQVNEILRENPVLDAIKLEALFPTYPESARTFTRQKLAAMSPEVLMPHLPLFKGHLLRLLPIGYFPNLIPWDSIKDDREKIRGMLCSDGFRETTSKDIAATFDIDKVLNAARFLNTQDLSIFSTDQLKHPRFPWMTFLGKGIGSQMRWLDPEAFSSPSIPWDELAKRPKEIQDFFTISNPSDEEKTGNILKKIPVKELKHIAPMLTPQHLKCFDKDQLKHADFPWDAFCQMKDIGTWMALYVDIDAFSSALIRWDLLEKEEIQDLFKITDKHSQDKTRDMFEQIPVEAFTRFAHGLTPNHLQYIKDDKLKHASFPWDVFCQMDQIGFYMRLWLEPEIFTVASINWEKFAQNKKEIDELFALEGYGGYFENRTKTQNILQAIPKEQVKHLFQDPSPALTNTHFELLTPQQQTIKGL